MLMAVVETEIPTVARDVPRRRHVPPVAIPVPRRLGRAWVGAFRQSTDPPDAPTIARVQSKPSPARCVRQQHLVAGAVESPFPTSVPLQRLARPNEPCTVGSVPSVLSYRWLRCHDGGCCLQQLRLLHVLSHPPQLSLAIGDPIARRRAIVCRGGNGWWSKGRGFCRDHICKYYSSSMKQK